MNANLADKRRHPRSKFTYPVKFTMFIGNHESASFKAYLKNMSVGGVCIRFEDRYGRIDFSRINGSVIKVSIDIPQEEKIYLRAMVHWIRKEDPQKGFFIRMGLELIDMEDWQVERIEKFINLKNKDQKMLWNLLDQHLQPK